MTADTKTKLYNRMRAALKELSPDDIVAASRQIQKRVLTMEEFRVSLRVGLYSSMWNEVHTEMLFIEGDRRRKEVYYPAVDEAESCVAFHRVGELKELRPGYAGILEPTSAASKLRDLQTLDVLIVPGLAFDLHGGRLGFGRGYYDRCLVGFRGKRIALAYDFQIVQELPLGVRGQKVDWIVTEKRMIRCEKRR